MILTLHTDPSESSRGAVSSRFVTDWIRANCSYSRDDSCWVFDRSKFGALSNAIYGPDTTHEFRTQEDLQADYRTLYEWVEKMDNFSIFSDWRDPDDPPAEPQAVAIQVPGERVSLSDKVKNKVLGEAELFFHRSGVTEEHAFLVLGDRAVRVKYEDLRNAILKMDANRA